MFFDRLIAKKNPMQTHGVYRMLKIIFKRCSLNIRSFPVITQTKRYNFL